ncbi:prepilin-type N-terminal cleavage/methylation domain-containing protein [Thermosediminibacter litoriperuensis]|uniref:Prepilin-type N-terminal cleavage/methylation domain-containing protein n=1 Tax=Thermosediminibacter litoriperuensis TaxID=291989 RepID=A0A5S5AM28_9FIRM|nr:prepilin-type N-terminal cleavage/methylation domain-containing protein [Thermosediminibacter litoriperuensis]TYP51618.1 prepilin-type N-terminal cleavage/methylation domain-containing protein [Thermosediminibacter litoriperuensis]
MPSKSSRFGGKFKTIQGLTLIELVLSIALLSVLLAAAFGLCNSGIKVYKRCLEELSNMQNARYAVNKLSTSIRQAREVRLISDKKIEIKAPDGSRVYYYLEYGILYREKYGGKNPVAELQSLEFFRPAGSNFIKITVKAGKEEYFILETAATPYGYCLD